MCESLMVEAAAEFRESRVARIDRLVAGGQGSAATTSTISFQHTGTSVSSETEKSSGSRAITDVEGCDRWWGACDDDARVGVQYLGYHMARVVCVP